MSQKRASNLATWPECLPRSRKVYVRLRARGVDFRSRKKKKTKKNRWSKTLTAMNENKTNSVNDSEQIRTYSSPAVARARDGLIFDRKCLTVSLCERDNVMSRRCVTKCSWRLGG